MVFAAKKSGSKPGPKPKAAKAAPTSALKLAAKKGIAKAKKEPKAKKEAKVKGPSVGSIARAAILEGKTNEQVIAEVKKQLPTRTPTNASINWYRSELRGQGKKVASSRKPAVKKEKAEKKPDAKKSTGLVAKTNYKPAPNFGRKKEEPKASASKDSYKPAAKVESDGGF